MPKREITVEIAADWVAAVDAGLTEPQQRELEAWLAAEPSHRAAFERLKGQYRAVDRLSEFRPADSDESDDDVPLLKDSGRIQPPWSDTPSQTEATSRPGWALPSWRVFLPLGIAASLALFFGYSFWWLPAHGSMQESAVTAVGDQRQLTLPDGSIVTLNTDSAVDVVYTPGERRLLLTKGEAYFAVAKDKARPFIVGVGNVAVRAVGTAFNIRLKARQIEVVVTEGLVKVDDTANGGSVLPKPEVYSSADFEDPVLAAGEQVVIAYAAEKAAVTAPPMIVPLAATEITQRLAWREQRLVFDPTPLRDVVAEFNRYNRRQLRVADEATGRMLVGGTFRADDIETLVRLLESSFGLTVEHHDNVIILKK
ncbi:MAG: anti-FecI sigma factor, FecR [Verrucomicrobia bacterium]|nr:anti-FecI sigma factor, FecR [Verrucomicrobiota bacterium]